MKRKRIACITMEHWQGFDCPPAACLRVGRSGRGSPLAVVWFFADSDQGRDEHLRWLRERARQYGYNVVPCRPHWRQRHGHWGKGRYLDS